MICPRCGSDNVQVQIVQEHKYGSFLTLLVRLALFIINFIVWLVSLLIKTSRIKNKTMAICNNCGNSWTPNPRKDLARQKKELKRLKAKERRKKAIEKIVASKFWQNEYFGYAMIFFLAPLGIFLMYRYNHKLTYSTKKKVAYTAISVWTGLLALVTIIGLVVAK